MRYSTPAIKSYSIADLMTQLGPARATLYTGGGGGGKCDDENVDYHARM